MRTIVFGDSIAHGVLDVEFGGWAGRLRKHLDVKEGKNYFSNLSISGDTSRGLLKRFESEAVLRIRGDAPKEISIIISIGTNDAREVRGNPSKNISPDEYRENMSEISSIAKKLADKVLVLGLLPVFEPKTSPFKEVNFYSNKYQDEYNSIAKECASKLGVPFKEFFSSWKEYDLEELFDDGLHPTMKGHQMLYEEIREFLEKKVE